MHVIWNSHIAFFILWGIYLNLLQKSINNVNQIWNLNHTLCRNNIVYKIYCNSWKFSSPSYNLSQITACLFAIPLKAGISFTCNLKPDDKNGKKNSACQSSFESLPLLWWNSHLYSLCSFVSTSFFMSLADSRCPTYLQMSVKFGLVISHELIYYVDYRNHR